MRTYIFIDGNNLWHTMKPYHVVIDYDRLAQWLTRQVSPDATFSAAYYYTGVLPPTGGPSTMDTFLQGLELRTGYHVRRESVAQRENLCHACGASSIVTTEKCVDTRLTADVVYYAATNAYDVGIIVSSDMDQLPAIEAASQLGRQVWIALDSTAGYRSELRTSAHGTILLETGLDQFTYLRRPPAHYRKQGELPLSEH